MGEVAEFNPRSILPDSFEYVDLESVVGTSLISQRTESKDTAPSRAQRLAKRGDVFFQTVRPYQQNNYLFDLLSDNYVFSTGYAQLRPNIDSHFLLCLLQEKRFLAKVLDNCTGTSYPAINSTTLADIGISVAVETDEQIVIGNFFRTLDTAITLHQRKLEGLRELKKGYLQQMFPQAGERVPKIRFAGFSNDWQERRLGEVADFSKGSGYSKSDLTDEGTPIILYGRLYTKYETIIENVTTFAHVKENSVISRGGEVIVPSSGETSEDISRASVVGKQGIIIGGDLNIVKANSAIYPAFLAITISNGKQQKELSKRAQGKSVVHISISDLKEAILQLPTFPEQIAISNFICMMDNHVTALSDKIERLKELKTAYLQKMFV